MNQKYSENYEYTGARHQRINGLWYRIEKNSIIDRDQYRHDLEGRHPATLTTPHPEASDYEEVIADHRRLVRELDVALNGDGAAKQASLCDIVAQLKNDGWELRRKTQPEASDREMAIKHLERLHGGKPETGSWHGINDKWTDDELIAIQVDHDATLRADERRKADGLRALIADLIASEPLSEDPRLDYIEIQIDRHIYEQARAILRGSTP